MKNTVFSISFICSLFFLMITACERTELQKSTLDRTQNLTTRSEFCENCDEDDCCCAVELQFPNSSTATLRLCGTADGTITTCSDPTPPSPCSAISGGGKAFVLNLNDPKEGFCMVKGNSFYVRNAGIADADIKITCQHDITGPQIITVTIPPGQTYYYGTNSSCEIAVCE